MIDNIQNVSSNAGYPNKGVCNRVVSQPQFSSAKAPSDNKTPPKVPLHLFLLGITAPLISLFTTPKLLKMLKSDAESGIDEKDVKKVHEYMWDKHKLADKNIKYYVAPVNSENAKFLLKNYSGGGYGFKQISVAAERKSLSLHEIGHAINFNCTKLGKIYNGILEKCSKLHLNPVTLAALGSSVLLVVGLVGTKNKGKEKQTDKTGTQKQKFSPAKFIHDNLGKLTLAMFTPMLMDESVATIRALRATKKIEPKMLKPLSRNLLIAFSSYLMPAAMAIISALSIRKFVDEANANKSK